MAQSDERPLAQQPPTVILRHCDSYQPDRIRRILEDGMQALAVKPWGRAMVKPNTVIAHPKLFPHAFTRSEFLDGLLAASRRQAAAGTSLTVGERCGITIPTRYAFAMAGYPRVLRRHGVKADYFEEQRQVPLQLHDSHALRPEIFIPESLTKCDFFINAPKLKAHPWTKITCSLKNFVGLQHDPQRLIDHDHMLHHKIVDLQEIIRADFIAVDAIQAGERTMLTPTPHPLNLIIMGTNPVAVDSICARILGLDPSDVDHIRLAADRGLGPLDPDTIELQGDVSLVEAQRRAQGLELTLHKVDALINGRGGLSVQVGPPPDTYDYCWGGCPGSLFEAMELIRTMQPEVYQQVKPMQVVIGNCAGPIDCEPSQRVLFVGDCTVWQGELADQPLQIASRYRQRRFHNPRTASSGDVVAKAWGVVGNLIRHRGEQAVRVPGCPVSVAELVLYLSFVGGTKNPYLDPAIFLRFVYYWALAKVMYYLKRIQHKLLPQSQPPRARNPG